ncbi:T9SS C-terminal target domain-containing protein [Arthrospiribacter ruber]|uniref:T9SS C-terminal target domain-containing protein n=2 Tax=Arthrospiribacter ruber TaxID=2487934 RepID=A0A951J643_9BACT|nr:T9SS type A sorting domain-containing protein [Arthrospiribacter ruber]MBW3470163.1 T9SS C-terminal target domain-containing protein [Arthrospiribacter ruber]
MSYCALQNVGVNFNLGFGLQPGNVIRNSVANANCLCECVSATISGPDFLCSTNTFTLQNSPVGSTVSWSASPAGMVGISGSGNSVNLTPQGNGQVTLTATITTDCGDVEVHKTFVTATGPIPTSAISLEPFESSPYVCPDQTFGFHPGPNEPWYQYEVQVVNGHYTEVSHGYFWIHFNNYIPSPPYPPVYDAGVSVRIHNGCSWSDWKPVSMYTEPSCPGGGGCELCFLTFPNPADEELQIQWNPQVKRTAGDDPGFDVQFYDQRGKILFSQSGISEKISLDTRKFKNGFYYLHIRYKDALIRRQIRVER